MRMLGALTCMVICCISYVLYICVIEFKYFKYCNSWSIHCRAVRAMNETLKQNRLMRERGDDNSFSHSPSNRSSDADLHKNVCLLYFANSEACFYWSLFSLPVNLHHFVNHFFYLVSKLLEFGLGLSQPYKTGLYGEGCPIFISTRQAISLGNKALNPPLHTEHNGSVGDCNEGQPKCRN